MQMIKKILLAIVGVKVTTFNTFYHFVPLNDRFGQKMVILALKVGNNIFEIICIFTAAKIHTSINKYGTRCTTTITPGIANWTICLYKHIIKRHVGKLTSESPKGCFPPLPPPGPVSDLELKNGVREGFLSY